MFEPSSNPRVFGVPPGLDFPKALIKGIQRRLSGHPPQAMARVEVFVNTRRMQRRMRDLFSTGQATLLPRIRLVTELSKDVRFSDIPPAVPALQRRLELTQLVGKLLEKEPEIAPRSNIYDLADSLADLLDEMQSEGVPPEKIHDLDVTDQSGHWQRSLEFVKLVEPFFSADAPGNEARQRRVIERLAETWQQSPPTHPIIVAGSTGSRGATSLFMQAVARLPQGAIILPGVDFDMPRGAWDKLDDSMTSEDHPQFRFAKLSKKLEISPRNIKRWIDDEAPVTSRNKLISLSLRPAPVTDQWLVDGPKLKDLDEATVDLTLIQAPSPRAEASAIALALRSAVERGVTAALISPDRTLTRQVTAALDRWRITPDDSAGRPLPLSAPGRLLRQIASLIQKKMTSDALLALLKHPLAATGGDDRGTHLLNTRELELWLRRFGPAFVDSTDVVRWANGGDEARIVWAQWLADILARLNVEESETLSNRLDHHISISEALCAGPSSDGSGDLWKEKAGEEARRWVDELQLQSGHGGILNAAEYSMLFDGVMRLGEVRDSMLGHPDVMIWGTLEARVQGADLVILAGLNEGTWPEPSRPDPWLNRALRVRAGLLLPDREIGLSAHDFQQAICAKNVILSRAVRNAESQTVPSRWINRLTNLLGGLGAEGKNALSGMTERGDRWIEMASVLDEPENYENPAPRPSPQPPVDARPKEITITEVQRLIRDPYAIYARRILRLSKLDPLRKEPDPPLRGTIVHNVIEAFVAEPLKHDLAEDCRTLMGVADRILLEQSGWPAARRLWRSRIERFSEWFVQTEYERQNRQTPAVLEHKGKLNIANLETVLVGKIDRIDQQANGFLSIYDYKTGAVPSKDQRLQFDKQLLLSAAMAERGMIEGIVANTVTEVGYIGLGSKPTFVPEPVESGDIDTVILELQRLLISYAARSRGYTSRRAVQRRGSSEDYDHLARYGEWDEGFDPFSEEVG